MRGFVLGALCCLAVVGTAACDHGSTEVTREPRSVASTPSSQALRPLSSAPLASTPSAVGKEPTHGSTGGAATLATAPGPSALASAAAKPHGAAPPASRNGYKGEGGLSPRGTVYGH